MPTNSETIRKLEVAVAELAMRIEATEDLRRTQEKLADEVKVLDRDVAAIKQAVAHIDKQLDRLVNQRFTIWVAIASAIFGAALTFGAQLMIRSLSK